MRRLCFLKDTYANVPLQGKIFYMLASVGTLFSVFNGLFSLSLGLPFITTIVSLITAFGCLVSLFIAYKIENYLSVAYVVFHILILFTLPFLWITNSGSKGPTGYFYIFILILISIIIDRPKIPFLIALMIITLAILIYIEATYPEYILPYKNPMSQILDTAVSAFLVGITSLGILLRLMKEYKLRIDELNGMHTKLYKLSITDELTGISNRRFVMNELENQLAIQENSNICIIMLDIDNFKTINDSFGHQIGDEVIKGTSQILTKLVRNIDLVGRIGGEEFLIILKATELENAIARAESMRKRIEDHTWSLPSVKVTISGGVYHSTQRETIDEILEKVDQLLYEAKTKGKNLIVW